MLADVEVEEGGRMLNKSVGCYQENGGIGLPVEVEYAQLEGDIAVPRFHPL